MDAVGLPEDLRMAILESFAEVAYPGDDDIIEGGGRYDSEQARALLRGRDWRTLRVEELEDDTLFFTTPQGFQYYLPAYLLAAYDLRLNNMYDTICYLLSPELTVTSDDWMRCHAILSKNQKQVIANFWRFNIEQYKEMVFADNEEVDERALGEAQRLVDYWQELADTT